MAELLNATIFVTVVGLLLMIGRPAPLTTRDVQVWNDETERRLLTGVPPGKPR